MCYIDKSIPDRSRPGLRTTASGLARQGTCKNCADAGLSENKRRKASEETTGTVQRDTHTHKSWYFKYRNNDWKGERAGRHNGAKECNYTVPTGNKVERE